MFDCEDLTDVVASFSGRKRRWVHGHAEHMGNRLIAPIRYLDDNDPAFYGRVGKSPWWMKPVTPWVAACCAGLGAYFQSKIIDATYVDLAMHTDWLRLWWFFRGIAESNKHSERTAKIFCAQLMKDVGSHAYPNRYGIHHIYGDRLTMDFCRSINDMNGNSYRFFFDDVCEARPPRLLTNISPCMQ